MSGLPLSQVSATGFAGTSRQRQSASDRNVMPEFLHLSSAFQNGLKALSDRVNSSFNRVDSSFNHIDHCFQSVESRLDRLEADLNRPAHHFFSKIERAMAEHLSPDLQLTVMQACNNAFLQAIQQSQYGQQPVVAFPCVPQLSRFTSLSTSAAYQCTATFIPSQAEHHYTTPRPIAAGHSTTTTMPSAAPVWTSTTTATTPPAWHTAAEKNPPAWSTARENTLPAKKLLLLGDPPPLLLLGDPPTLLLLGDPPPLLLLGDPPPLLLLGDPPPLLLLGDPPPLLLLGVPPPLLLLGDPPPFLLLGDPPPILLIGEPPPILQIGALPPPPLLLPGPALPPPPPSISSRGVTRFPYLPKPGPGPPAQGRHPAQGGPQVAGTPGRTHKAIGGKKRGLLPSLPITSHCVSTCLRVHP
ncbi:uncharacterized protein [Dendrobates tinctorius]|uniref:uncharacterized protein n=1 Tax=Dendrobates tinctorius TaxID=92724 RepID=UPI003CC99AF0